MEVPWAVIVIVTAVVGECRGARGGGNVLFDGGDNFFQCRVSLWCGRHRKGKACEVGVVLAHISNYSERGRIGKKLDPPVTQLIVGNYDPGRRWGR